MQAQIGTVVGFPLWASTTVNGLGTISTVNGTVFLQSGARIDYRGGSSAGISRAWKGRRVRVCAIDDSLKFKTAAIAHQSGPLTLIIDDDDTVGRGVYEGGLIVLGHVTFEAETKVLAVAPSQADKPLDPRQEKSLLRIIRAMDVLLELPERGAAKRILKKLHLLGFTSTPDVATIRKALKDARSLEPDSKPQ